ncbi:hypothetical protein M5E88_14390 [Akkermansia muciniphila]|nr:hypothetical protein M5E88_14390 [Akkermansia muciniphila]
MLIDFGAALNKPEVTCTVTQGEFSYAYASRNKSRERERLAHGRISTPWPLPGMD